MFDDEDDDGFEELTEELQQLALEQHFVYLQAKATRFVAMGAIDYRRQDALGCPPSTTPKPILDKLRLGCEQIVAWRGLTEETALEGLGIDGFYALAGLFHLRPVHQTARALDDDRMLDRMDLVHEVTGHATTLWNIVDSPTRKRRVKSKKDPDS